MNDIIEFMHRVADEADPPTVYNRANAQDMEEYILLSDLVEAHSYLDEGLKREFISLMIEMHGEGEPSSDVIMENLEDFATMDPVVDFAAMSGGQDSAA
jgi:hypothetical protein